jgi:hypothetical protein
MCLAPGRDILQSRWGERQPAWELNCPTGKQIQFSGCSIYRFKDDLIVEQWEYGDMLSMLQQLGVIPALG